MKYIVGELSNRSIIIDVVTDDPCGYVIQFEPIDIINGEQYAWNKDGERFKFFTNTDYDNRNHTDRAFSIVGVGSWGSKGPVMKLDGKDDIEILKSALVNYLQTSSKDEITLSKYSLLDLFNAALEKG